jgi:hypothetical protein
MRRTESKATKVEMTLKKAVSGLVVDPGNVGNQRGKTSEGRQPYECD